MGTVSLKLVSRLTALLIFFLIQPYAFADNPCPKSDDLIMSWMQKRITVEEAEAANLVTDERLGPDPVPFGFINDDWKKLLSLMREGDELWEFDSPPETWEKLAGRRGIALVRECRVLYTIITLMN